MLLHLEWNDGCDIEFRLKSFNKEGLVTEFQVMTWSGGWSHRQKFLHLEWNDGWYIRDLSVGCIIWLFI